MVVADGIAAGGLQIPPDRFRRGEIERRPADLRDLARRHQRIARRVGLREQRQLVIGDGPGVLPAQVPVAVVRHVDQRDRVGGGAHRHPQLVLPGQRVEAAGGDGAGVALFAVARAVDQPQRRPVRRVHGLRAPDHLVPAFDAAVQVVRAVVGRHREPAAVQLERARSGSGWPPARPCCRSRRCRPDTRRDRRTPGRRRPACRPGRAPPARPAWPRTWPPWQPRSLPLLSV